MKAMVSCASKSRGRNRPIAAFLLAAAFIGPSEVGAAEQETAAVLKLHEVSFVYRTSAYALSCGDIRGRVGSVLRVLGAREDLQVRVSGCNAVVMPLDQDRDPWLDESDPYRTSSDRWSTTDPFERSSEGWVPSSDRFVRRGRGPRQSTHVEIRAMLPVEMTPQVQAQLEKDKSRRELISRVNPSAGLAEPIVFPAERRLVELSRKTLDLDPEECELMVQMSRSVFKKIGVRVVRRPSCPDRASNISPKLTVEALLPKLPTVPMLSPAEGEGEATERSDND